MAIAGGPEKDDRIAVVVTGLTCEKLLAILKMVHGTGEQVAKAAAETLYSWSLINDIVGMSFDTTAANTGHLNGAVCSWSRKVAENCSGWLVDDIILLKYCVVTFSERFLVQRQVQM